ncbi:hypothetical protein LCL89_06790 [Halobacillus yeomjeoni]|uniref:S-Ena type endospore appendage n=1 Tax=Halobacillus yeomjeoni TaxID=311194 RepID=UPI001CD3FE4F|nr:S-Ena type endospore appendage [Halobacillus yeomjeoni]MCA0983763.1 hypothetical protein [Halobacillus yeomjeoni]
MSSCSANGSSDICGNFRLPCNSGLIDIFNIVGNKKKATGSITIFFDTGCSDHLQIVIEDSKSCQLVFTVNEGSTRTLVVDDFVKIQLSCPHCSNLKPCVGKYCLDYKLKAIKKEYYY